MLKRVYVFYLKHIIYRSPSEQYLYYIIVHVQSFISEIVLRGVKLYTVFLRQYIQS